jgi:cell division septation protein DedD
MRDFRDDEEPARRGNDTELTLSTTTLVSIVLGLLLLCGLCFGAGYFMGSRGPKASPLAADQPALAQASLPVSGAAAKPSARSQAAGQPADASTLSSSDASDATPGQPATADDTSSAHPRVQPALPASPQTASSPSSYAVQAAIPPAGSIMVQIAAVTHAEDADVLVNALRKRGYAVTASRLTADNLIHVQIGPFTSRDEAYRWRQKLLNDGYNAIVQP